MTSIESRSRFPGVSPHLGFVYFNAQARTGRDIDMPYTEHVRRLEYVVREMLAGEADAPVYRRHAGGEVKDRRSGDPCLCDLGSQIYFQAQLLAEQCGVV